MKKVELLSPAGSMLSLKAAVHSGADAIYLGATKLNARISAENFDETNIGSAIAYAKLRNVKVYITLNTLVYNNEMDELLKLVNKLHSYGADAVIIQDFGVLKELIENTKIDIHASTQMAIHNSDGAKFLEDLGVSRVVLSRETSIEKIKEIKANTNIELETFIHGALCSSFSGQCLISFLHGGRSGNRGTCAQPCRESYSGANTKYPLSTKDLMTLDIIPALIDSGVASFKIEGRMKRPEYVKVTTSIYRKAIDLAYEKKDIPVEKYREELVKIFNRGGFSSGYLLEAKSLTSMSDFPQASARKATTSCRLFGNDKPNHQGEYVGKVVDYKKNKIYIKTDKVINVYDGLSFGASGMEISDLYQDGVRVMSGSGNLSFSAVLKDVDIGDKVFRTTDKKQIDNAREVIENDTFKRPLKAKCIIDKNIILQLESGEYKVKCESENELEIAKTRGVTKEDILLQLKKIGGSVFEFRSDDDIEIIINGNYFVPVKEINEVRRGAIAMLESDIIKSVSVERKLLVSKEIKNIDNSVKVLVSNNISVARESYNYFIYAPKNYDKNITELFNNKQIDGIILPHITFDSDIEIIKNIVTEKMIVVCNNIGQFYALKGKCKLWAGIGMNVINNYTVEFLYNIGFDVVVSSIESSRKLTNTLSVNGGFIPVMHFLSCPKNVSVECQLCNTTDIKDKKGNVLLFNCTTIDNKVSYIMEKVNFGNGNIEYSINN